MCIVARALLSWFPISRDNFIIVFLRGITEPIISPIRKLIQNSPLGGPGMMIDFSPLIAFALIEVVTSLLVQLIASL